MAPGGLARNTWALTAVVVLAQFFGNLALSWGMKRAHPDLGLSPVAYVATIFTPWVAAGVALLVVWLLSRMALLSWADLSFVLPVTAIGYVFTAFGGLYFFGERISPQRWAGTLLIVAGTALVGLTSPRTAPLSSTLPPSLSPDRR